LSPVFPLVVAQYARASAAGSASGIIFSAAGLGGAALPALVGLLSQHLASLRTGMSTVLLCIAAMLWLEWRLIGALRYPADRRISD
jgi:fucose permease